MLAPDAHQLRTALADLSFRCVASRELFFAINQRTLLGAQVLEGRSGRRLGRKGVLNFSVDYVLAADGTQRTRVPLRAQIRPPRCKAAATSTRPVLDTCHVPSST
jgi:hypothetical protein